MRPGNASPARFAPPRRGRPAALAAWLVAALALAAGASPLAARSAGRAAAPRGADAQAPSTQCVPAVQDAGVFEALPDVSGGLSTTLKVGPAARLRTRAYARFDLASLPAEAIVLSATLRMYLEELQFQSVPVMTTELLAAADDWDEATLTWNNQPGPGTSFGTRNHDDTPGIKTWHALGLVEAWRDQGNAGLVLEGRVNPLIGNAFEATFAARESTAHPGPSLCYTWSLPTLTPTATITPTLTLTPTVTPRVSATATPTEDRTRTPTATGVPTATATASATATPDERPTPTASPTIDTASVVGILVTDPGDGDDADPSDGRCADAAGSCTLRAALRHALGVAPGRSVRIRFARPMTIVVPHGRPLPPLARPGLDLRGLDDPPAHQLGDARPDAQAPLAKDVVVTGVVAGRPSPDAGLRVEADGVVVQGLELTGFAAGILLADGARGALVGSDLDGRTDVEEGNRLTGNRDGLRIEADATGHTVRFNVLLANLRHGISTARTAGSANHLTRNLIARNGRAAIGVDRGGAEVPAPVIAAVDPRTGGVRGTGCAGCIVELYADGADQASRYLDGGTVAVLPDGTWSVGGLALTAADGNVTATATRVDRGAATSRLSAPMPRDGSSRWRLVAVPPRMPRAMVGRTIRRTYRLVDALGRPVPEATLAFRPYDGALRFETQPGGLVEVVIPTALALDLWRAQLHVTLEAVEQRTGERHPVDWLPRLGAALELPAGDPLALDLSDLSNDGLGAVLRRAGGWTAARDAAPGAPAAQSPASQTGDAAAVGFLVAPADAREGPYAWQENLAAGGAIYQVAAGDEAPEGTLEIQAPAAAYDGAGASSGCPGAPAGAVMAGWREQDICWVPVPGSSAAAPASGQGTFAVSAAVDVPPAGGVGATTAFTLYTVGHDTTPPVILPELSAGASVATLPAVLASAVDDAAGVRASTGIVVTLGGVSVPATYDAASREIRVPPAARGLPATLPEGPADLVIAVEDGFCNRATRAVTLIVARAAPAKVFLPRGERGR